MIAPLFLKTMKVDELMIGDWVDFVYGMDKHYYQRVKSIGKSLIDTTNLWQIMLTECNPIPITQDILEQNGFLNSQFFGELVIDGFQIQCDGHNLRIRTKEAELLHIKCEYVHEMQNAFRLCGINKEIEL